MKIKMNNNDEIYLNDVVMEEEKMEEFRIQPSLQTKKNINANEGKKKMNFFLKKMHFQRKKLTTHVHVLTW